MKNRKETKVNKLIGRIGEEYYFCDDLFEYSDDFKGATGSVMRPVPQEEYLDRISTESIKDYLKETWVETVKMGRTEQSLDEWIEEVRNTDGDDFLFDESYPEYAELLRLTIPQLNDKDYPVIECSGGGRCFSTDMVFDEIYDQEALNLILAQEEVHKVEK